MKRYSLFFLLPFLLTACYTYQLDRHLPTDRLYSPPFDPEVELFEADKSYPESPIVTIKEERISTGGNLKQQLKNRMLRRGLDGAIINYRAFATSTNSAVSDNTGDLTFYNSATHYAEYYPFMYLNKIEARGFLDSVVMEVEVNDTLLERFVFKFDWREQLTYIPAGLGDHFNALALQPWFFLKQRGQSWRSAPYHSSFFDKRRYGYSPRSFTYIPRARGNAYKLYAPGPDFDLWFSTNSKGAYALDSLQYKGQKAVVQREDFFGLRIKESWQMPEGPRYKFRYFYKKREDVPSEWIIHPTDLQH